MTIFDNPDNWEIIYQEEKISPIGSNLPDFLIPQTHNSKYLVIKTNCNIPEGKEWEYAGKLQIKRIFPFSIQSVITNQLSLRLNESKLITIENYLPYQLLFNPPSWLSNLKLTIWKYIMA